MMIRADFLLVLLCLHACSRTLQVLAQSIWCAGFWRQLWYDPLTLGAISQQHPGRVGWVNLSRGGQSMLPLIFDCPYRG